MQGSAFEELTRHHYGEVARVAFLLTGDRQEALDVTQETFARAYERWGQVAAMENQVGWLVRVATNLALTHRRRSTRWARTLQPAYVEVAVPPEPSVTQALAKLTPAQRAAVILRFYLDLSIAETAQILKKRPGTIRALTSQGTARLRALLGETWMEVRDD